jgi:DNA-binding response OmpR family regulator
MSELTIVVAHEDLEAVRRIGDALRSSGAVVEGVVSGAAAVEAAGRIRPDLVLVDEGLVRRDGGAWLRSLHERARVTGMALALVAGTAEPSTTAIDSVCALLGRN